MTKGRPKNIKSHKWNEVEDDFIRKYAQMGVKWIAEALNKKPGQVINRAYWLRISLAAKPRKLPPSRKPRSGRNYISVKERVCPLPPFHPVMLGLYPQSRLNQTHLWKSRRRIILKMHDSCCVYCGDDANTVDHIVPIDLGGTDEMNNLVAACGRCNYAKANRIKNVVFVNA